MDLFIASTFGLIIGIAVPATLLVIVALILLIVFVLHCKNKSSSYSTRGSTVVMSKVVTGEVTINPNLAYDVTDQSNSNALHDTLKYDVVIDRNPAYGAVLNQKKKKGDYDYVVSSDEMIKTDTNPSYVPISVGDNVLEDNPSYQTV